ncbi:hypothetical protein GGI06_002538 [Coemansia sp. S85]|nr:hypothetical protein GGI06_002538 [Coemansia sp. S85]
MSLRDELSTSAPVSPSPRSGQYVSILRRTLGGVLFSDPVYVPPTHTLPELPDGLQYIVVHPSEVPARSQTLTEFLSASTKAASDTATRPQTSQPLPSPTLPQEEDYGSFSSFLPMRDSSLSTLDAADYAIISTRHVTAQPIDKPEPAQPYVLDDESKALISGMGLTPADLGFDDEQQHTTGAVETAEDILNANAALMAELVAMQDSRAKSGNFGQISEKEQAIAAKLQANLVRATAAFAPAELRPPRAEIQRVASRLLDKSSGSYAGTLPPQRRYAFVSNASSSSIIPPTATMAPMQRAPQPKP